MSAVVELKDVTRIFDKGIGVMHVDLSVEAGTCLALIGPNGAGKTTTLRLVMGMLKPDSGDVRVFDMDPRESPIIVKRRIGYVSEDQPLPPWLTPGDMFSLFASLYPKWSTERALGYADELELPVGRQLGHMSTGQRRQAALIGAIAHKPELLVLDEPAGGLDPLVRRTFMESVIELLGREGTTVLFSSHQLDQVERLADRIAFLNRGKVVLERSAQSLQEEAVRVLADGVDAEGLREREGVLAVRKREERVAITVLAPEEDARALVEDRLGGRVVQSRQLGLEDLFVDLMRGTR